MTDIDECTVASLQGRRLCSEGEVCLNEDGTYDCVCAPGTYRVRIVEPDNSWSTVCYSEYTVTVHMHADDLFNLLPCYNSWGYI